MENDVVITKMGDTDIYTPGRLPDPGVQAEFMVGTFGPFRVKTIKTGDWSNTLRQLIDEEVRRVRSLQA